MTYQEKPVLCRKISPSYGFQRFRKCCFAHCFDFSCPKAKRLDGRINHSFAFRFLSKKMCFGFLKACECGGKVKAPFYSGKQFYDREITLMRWNFRRNKSARHGTLFLSLNFIVDFMIYDII